MDVGCEWSALTKVTFSLLSSDSEKQDERLLQDIMLC